MKMGNGQMVVAFGKKVLRDTLRLYWNLLKIMVPIMILVEIGIRLGMVDVVGEWLGPVMGVLDLPPEAGIVLAANIFVGFYGAAAALISFLPTMEYSIVDATVLGGMMLIAHSLPVEQRIVQKTGCSILFTTVFRLLAAFLYGWLLQKSYSFIGGFDQPATTLWTVKESDGSWLTWIWDSVQSLFMIFWVLLGLIGGLALLEAAGVTARLTRLLAPALRLLGIGPNAAPLAMVGMLLGIAFGGGLILNEIAKGHLRPRSIFLAMCLMCVCHSLIEDTLIVMALGADWVGVLLGRLAFTLAICIPLAVIIHSLPDRTFHRYFYKSIRDTAKPVVAGA